MHIKYSGEIEPPSCSRALSRTRRAERGNGAHTDSDIPVAASAASWLGRSKLWQFFLAQVTRSPNSHAEFAMMADGSTHDARGRLAAGTGPPYRRLHASRARHTVNGENCHSTVNGIHSI